MIWSRSITKFGEMDLSPVPRRLPKPVAVFLVGAAVVAVLCSPTIARAAVNIAVQNGSFEDVDVLAVGGVWPEVDSNPLEADFWLEPGPVSKDLNAFPPELIPPGFSPPDQATLDTGVFFNAPFNQTKTGDLVANPSFVTNAAGNQLAYMFAKDDLDPSIGFIQELAQTYERGLVYTLTADIGRSFFLPPIGGNRGDPTMALRFWYEDEAGQKQALAQTQISASSVQSTVLTEFMVKQAVGLDDPWHGRPIGIELAPTDGSSGAWIFDNVQLTAVPEPSVAVVMGWGAMIFVAAWRVRLQATGHLSDPRDGVRHRRRIHEGP